MNVNLLSWLPLLLVAGAATLCMMIAAAALPLLRDLRLMRYAQRSLRQRNLVRATSAPVGNRSSAAPIMRDAENDWLARFDANFPQLRARLDATGYRIAPRRLFGYASSIAVFVAAGAMFVGLGAGVALIAALVAGIGLPWLGVGWLVQRRRARFAAGMPDAVGLIVRGLKAGLPIAETIVEVGRAIEGPVGEEFAGVGNELRLGQSLEAALWAVARRMRLVALNFFVITLSVQRETGGNLAETLGNVDEILRGREAMRLKIKAMSSEAVASAVIIGTLPLVMGGLMLIASPGYIDPLFTTRIGHLLLGAATASMAIGALVMRQMVQFEI